MNLIMMIRMLFSKTIILVTFCLISSVISAQYENKNTIDLKTEAGRNYASGNYSTAFEQYKTLLVRYPKDGIFSYYSGLCLLNMNKDIARAIEFLEYSSSKATVPYDVLYFLGNAYTRNYQFPKAKKAYEQFALVASKSEEKELMPVRLSEMSANAVMLTASYNEVDILASSLFTFTDSAYISQLHAPGGSLSVKPAELMPGSEGIKDLSNLMFIPGNIEKGDLLFYTANGKTKKRGTDIFMVKAGSGKKYSEQTDLVGINTEYDEILPYYDPIGKDLIFASKGHNSMGGFDLFKSHYDAERNSWTTPINLGFPVNSPSDEFLMIPGTDMGNIMLITNRQGLDSMIIAYMLRIHEPRVNMAVIEPDELKKIGNFGGIEAIPGIIDMSIQDILTKKETQSGTASTMAPAKHPKPGDERGGMPADYNKFLRLALDQQFKADSLARLARDGRIEVKTITGPDEKWKKQKSIISWEKESSEFQVRADEYYLMVKQMENTKPEAKKLPAAIVKDTVINDITVYKYKQADTFKGRSETEQLPVVEETSDNPPDERVPKVMPENPDKERNHFAVLGKSPYSANNPFPEEMIIPMGVYYKIQLAVKSKEPEWDTFGGISPVTTEPVADKPMKKYYAGKFVNYESSKSALEEVRRNGFPEAFIVSWYDGQKMTLSKVVELEKK